MPKRLLTLAVLLMPLTLHLVGCASPTPVTSPGAQTSSASAACLSLAPVEVNRGKPGGPSTEDVAAALDRDHPIERVRNLVGDTSSTLTQVDRNNAAIASLCGGGTNAGLDR